MDRILRSAFWIIDRDVRQVSTEGRIEIGLCPLKQVSDCRFESYRTPLNMGLIDLGLTLREGHHH